MEAIQSFLSGIGESIVSVINFVVTFFRDFIQFLGLLVKMPEVLVMVFSWIPSEILTSMMVLFTVVILYKVLGREG